ncbi:hypothetical protein NC651_010324 [Populus alba x Populus x berolinensis]|nr:hypothetical protein NC651_010324 [Populus alba x Populus x berolinensis]
MFSSSVYGLMCGIQSGRCMENLNYMQKGLLLATTDGYERLQSICWANLLWHLESSSTPVIPAGKISFGIRKFFLLSHQGKFLVFRTSSLPLKS